MKKGDLLLKIKKFKTLAFVAVAVLTLHTSVSAYTTFNYNEDSSYEPVNKINQNIETRESNSSNIILLSTSSIQKLEPMAFLANIPTKGVVSSEYGARWGGYHLGFDIAADKGDGIYAAANGVVEYASELSTYGLMVEIDHGNGFKTIYAHCSKLDVEVGQCVTRGDKIAEIGSTGDSTGNHVHFEVIKEGVKVDPKNYFIQPTDYGV